MRRYLINSGRKNEQGLIITLVAIFMLGVVGAMAALAIDVVTLYTARSEAQLAADGAALAGARVLANSGMTSDPNAVGDGLRDNAITLATAVATQVAASNQVGGRTLSPTAGSPCSAGEICVTINTGLTNFLANPRVTVTVQRSDLPTFFARIWGTTQLAVKATATAEGYNPSTLGGTGANEPAVAPICVKPWILPNLDPSSTPTPGANPIFNANGSINTTTLLGWETQSQTTPSAAPAGTYLSVACPGGDCSVGLPAPKPWLYYPGDPGVFTPPAASSATCSPTTAGFTPTPYQLSIAGCMQAPISCNQSVLIDTTNYPTRDSEAASAVNCLAHATGNKADRMDETTYAKPYYPFEFLAGGDAPLVGAGVITEGKDIAVSDSVVTVPVFNLLTNPATIIGFVQLFLNPEGRHVHMTGVQAYQIHTMVINMVGCGTSASTTSTSYGNGPSAVPVRLITPPLP
ncbi:MAG: pilus assembly protein TadG-related protein [Terriglobales bacterium]